MSDSRFDKDSIQMRVLDSQIIYHNGYAEGMNQMKRMVLMKIESELLRSQLAVDFYHYRQLLYLKNAIESL